MSSSAKALVTTVEEVRQVVGKARANGMTVGFVPTMGALHTGHARLITTAAMQSDFVVTSVFVNPTQFGPNEDFSRYPRALEADVDLATRAGARIVFHPDISEIYPNPTPLTTSLPPVASRWEGTIRPGHFEGVVGVCLRLFNIIEADRAYFGQKDLQQLRVIEAMVKDFRLGLQIVTVRTVRDADTLALSSRNAYLSADERTNALVIRRALVAGRELIKSGERNGEKINRAMNDVANSQPGGSVDYLAVVESQTLEPLEIMAGEVALIAAIRVGKTRLIDNEIITIQ